MKPQLRFKEFTDEWEEKKLGEIADVRDGTHSSPKFVKEGYPLITSKNLKDGKLDYSSINYISKHDYEEINKRSYVEDNDILMAMIGTIGNPVKIVKEKEFAIKNVALIKDKNKQNNYLIHYLQSNNIKKQFLLELAGGTQKFISLSTIRNIKIQLPPLLEQEKIGKFFSLLDQRIEKQERKVTLLEEEKKGYMQKLFKQELRFKDEEGNDYPEWEEKKLGEIAKIYDGMHSTPNYKNHGVPFLSVENISDLKTNKYISEEEYQNSFKNNKAEYGDIFMTRIGSIGVANINLNNEVAYYVSLALIKPQKINNWYLMHAIHSEQVQKDLWSKTLQVAFPQKINKGDINFIKIPFPSLPEQEKIGNFLSLLDQRIEKEQEKLRLMKKEKQGLLQQLFICK
ncbi:restriction endonuclease subunit S [Catellicoccus marimammalium]|uniref:Type I restriction-modification system, specificity subunit S n=1 Tax=Catellicoccus marimammalium M35/04/3 TaxID=1234409 RepID=K8ZB03_9ENTE|nr:restriction endonuclease subunit S [Catellicoccus marimammalium]EKU27222.1 Type I restriction-modification system, specificity subunit S [Catellicoccus marimammalium M35/04/3]